MRLSEAENCQAMHCTIYWEISRRFSEGGHNNTEQASADSHILGNSLNESTVSGYFILAVSIPGKDEVVLLPTVSETLVRMVASVIGAIRHYLTTLANTGRLFDVDGKG